jgi:hypothetical protein
MDQGRSPIRPIRHNAFFRDVVTVVWYSCEHCGAIGPSLISRRWCCGPNELAIRLSRALEKGELV